MAIYRGKHQNSFTTYPNSLVQNNKMSYPARGLLEFMLSLPPDWKFHVSYLVKQSPSDGETKVRKYLKEIREAGYVKIVERPRKNGRYDGNDWIIVDTPQFSPHGDLPDAVVPNADLPDAVNQALQNKHSIKETDNKEIIKSSSYSSSSEKIKSEATQINQEEERVNKYKNQLEWFQMMNDCNLTPNDQKRFIRKMLQKRDSDVMGVFKQVGILPDRIADPPAYLYRYLDNLGDVTDGNS